MNNSDLLLLQKTQLEIMDEVHKICIENHLIYYLIGGSAIGAIRHQGPIPWDVDIDVGIPRSDYIRFREYCIDNLDDSKFEFHDWTNSEDYIPPHALLCKKNTRVKTIYSDYNKKQREYGAFVDIIPLDNVPSNIKARNVLEYKLRLIQRIKSRKICYFYDDFSNNKLKHIIKTIISKLLFFISVKQLNELEEKVLMSYYNDDTGYMGSLAGRYSFEKECKPCWVFGNPQLVCFSGREYYIPEHIHEFLKMQYGDYMKYPSIEEQQANLNYYTEIVL